MHLVTRQRRTVRNESQAREISSLYDSGEERKFKWVKSSWWFAKSEWMTTGDRWKTKSKINNKVQIGKVVHDIPKTVQKINTSTATRKSWDSETGQAGGVR